MPVTFLTNKDKEELERKIDELPTDDGTVSIKSMTYDSATNEWTLTYTDDTTSTVDGPAVPDVSGYMPKSGGIFTGSVQTGTASTTSYHARNIKFSETAETPTNEGDICFKLK